MMMVSNAKIKSVGESKIVAKTKTKTNEKTKKKRIKAQDFRVLEASEYEKMNENNYTVSQLKSIARVYQITMKGKKQELWERIYSHLKKMHLIPRIQKCWKNHVFREIRRIRGESLFCRKKCVNTMDFLSLEPVKDIPLKRFITYKDEKGLCYGFDLKSVVNSFDISEDKSSGNQLNYNPFTRTPMKQEFLKDVRKIIKYSKFANILIDGDININTNMKHLSAGRRLDLEMVSLFQKIDEFGYVTDPNWFFKLNKSSLIRFHREVSEIWFYRSQTSLAMKKNICHPHGNPFKNIDTVNILTKTVDELKNNVCGIMNNLLNCAVDKDSQSLGVLYVLSVFTLLSPAAAGAMPWLYDSVIQQNAS